MSKIGKVLNSVKNKLGYLPCWVSAIFKGVIIFVLTFMLVFVGLIVFLCLVFGVCLDVGDTFFDKGLNFYGKQYLLHKDKRLDGILSLVSEKHDSKDKISEEKHDIIPDTKEEKVPDVADYCQQGVIGVQSESGFDYVTNCVTDDGVAMDTSYKTVEKDAVMNNNLLFVPTKTPDIAVPNKNKILSNGQVVSHKDQQKNHILEYDELKDVPESRELVNDISTGSMSKSHDEKYVMSQELDRLEMLQDNDVVKNKQETQVVNDNFFLKMPALFDDVDLLGEQTESDNINDKKFQRAVAVFFILDRMKNNIIDGYPFYNEIIMLRNFIPDIVFFERFLVFSSMGMKTIQGFYIDLLDIIDMLKYHWCCHDDGEIMGMLSSVVSIRQLGDMSAQIDYKIFHIENLIKKRAGFSTIIHELNQVEEIRNKYVVRHWIKQVLAISKLITKIDHLMLEQLRVIIGIIKQGE